MANKKNGRGLATSPPAFKACDVCHERKAEIPISSDDGDSRDICEACDKKLFGTDLTEVQDIILSALRDYRRWWDGKNKCDREMRKQIDHAIDVMENIQ